MKSGNIKLCKVKTNVILQEYFRADNESCYLFGKTFIYKSTKLFTYSRMPSSTPRSARLPILTLVTKTYNILYMYI